MNSRFLLRFLVLTAILLAVAPDLAAQRGGKKARRGGANSGRPFLPPALPPIKIPKPLKLPASAKRPTSLLPEAAAPADGEELGSGITLPKSRNVVFWTDPRDPELEEYYFQLCDHDENNWISYREGSFSLRLSRTEFPYYDHDHDGRIDRAEFAERYGLIVDKQGVFAPPRARSEDYASASGPIGTLLGTQTAETDEARILARFDTNGSGGVELGELPPLIEFWNLTIFITPPQLLEAIDGDGSSALEVDEMTYLVDSLRIAQRKFNKQILSFDELSALSPSSNKTVTERSAVVTISRSKLPTVHFDRLDQNGDSFIGQDDLRILQSPMQLSVRTNAVIAAIDLNGDGKISLEEFSKAFE